jgi:hypothetical protein
MSSAEQSEIELFDIAGIRIAVDLSWLIVFAMVFRSLAAGYFPSLHPGYPWTEYFAVGFGAKRGNRQIGAGGGTRNDVLHSSTDVPKIRIIPRPLTRQTCHFLSRASDTGSEAHKA